MRENGVVGEKRVGSVESEMMMKEGGGERFVYWAKNGNGMECGCLTGEIPESSCCVQLSLGIRY